MNWDIFWPAALASLPPTIAACAAAYVAIRNKQDISAVKHATNSMKDALVAAALIQGRHEGAQSEKMAESVRQEQKVQ